MREDCNTLKIFGAYALGRNESHKEASRTTHFVDLLKEIPRQKKRKAREAVRNKHHSFTAESTFKGATSRYFEILWRR